MASVVEMKGPAGIVPVEEDQIEYWKERGYVVNESSAPKKIVKKKTAKLSPEE